jgi:hypothetical protein
MLESPTSSSATCNVSGNSKNQSPRVKRAGRANVHVSSAGGVGSALRFLQESYRREITECRDMPLPHVAASFGTGHDDKGDRIVESIADVRALSHAVKLV